MATTTTRMTQTALVRVLAEQAEITNKQARAILDHVPEDRVAGRGERLDVGTLRDRGEQVGRELRFLVVTELDLE